MRKHKIEQGDYFVSDDFLRTLKEEMQLVEETPKKELNSQEICQIFAEAALSSISEDLAIREYQKLYGKLIGLEKIAILNAHGDVSEGNWVYIDEKQERPVQNWINKRDGKYSSLILFSCYNPHELNLSSKKSLLLIPDRIIGLDYDLLSVLNKVCWTIFDPRLGEVSPYAYDYEINQMKKQLGEN